VSHSKTLYAKPGLLGRLFGIPEPIRVWPTLCLKSGMVKIHCNLGKKHRMIDKFVPGNRSEQTRFGLVDEVVIAIISFSLLTIIGLICLWVR